MSLTGKVHSDLVYGRRVKVLSQRLSELLPQNARILDVGCGDGLIDRLIMDIRPDVTIEGIDVLMRDTAHIEMKPFDGDVIPHEDASFDVVMFVDVLHHTSDPTILLKEAARVSRAHVVIKDHTRDGVLAGPTLRFMDWVGNAHIGVVLPYNYWPEKQWRETFASLGWTIEQWENRVGLYPNPANLVFGRSLHYIARMHR